MRMGHEANADMGSVSMDHEFEASLSMPNQRKYHCPPNLYIVCSPKIFLGIGSASYT